MESYSVLASPVHQVLEKLSHQLHALLRDNLVEIRLYGSWARQQAHPHSDVDIVVVVQQLTLNLWHQVYELAARLSLEHDLVLSINLLAQQEWEELQRLQTLYARRLQEEGVPL